MFLSLEDGGPSDEPAGGTHDDDDDGIDRDRVRAPLVEILLVGHLPVRGSLWLTPYAERIAEEQCGPVTIVRLDGEEPALQLVGHDPEVVRNAAGANWRDAIRRLGTRTSAWIIRMPAVSDPRTWFDAGVDRITVLTSGDQPAVAGAYQVTKQAVDAAPDDQSIWPQLGLAVVGVEERQAHRVAANLQRTADECLGVTLELVLTLPRLDVTGRTTRHLEFDNEVMPTLDEVLESLDVAMLGFDDADLSPPPPMRLVGADDTADDVDATYARDDAPEIETQRSPVPPPASDSPSSSRPRIEPLTTREYDIPRLPRHAARNVLRTDDEHHSREPRRGSAGEPIPNPRTTAQPTWSVRRGRKLVPGAKIELETKTDSLADPTTDDATPRALSTYVTGLAPLPMRPPKFEHIELAVDEFGALHLLARESDLRALRKLEQWARDHREILAMASGVPPRIDLEKQEITCHVFTDQPARLADLHDAGLLLHVLAPVDIGGRRGWFAAPLNDS